MDRSFFAIATFLHRVPRDAADPRAKRKSGTAPRSDHDSREPDFADGWIRVAL